MKAEGEIVLIGLGHPERGDDGVGLLLAAELGRCRLAGVRVETGVRDAAELLDAWRGAGRAIVLDCVRSGRPAGTVHCIEPFDGSLDGISTGSSTHALGIGAAVELGRVLGELPRRLALIGIEGASFAMGGSASAEVRGAIPSAVRAARQVIARWRGERCSASPLEGEDHA